MAKLIVDIEDEVHATFKAACAMKQEDMSAIIRRFMEEYSDEVINNGNGN